MKAARLDDEVMLGAIDRLYRASLDGQAWPDALDTFGRITGGLGLFLRPTQAGNGPLPVAYASPDLSHMAALIEGDWGQHNPRGPEVYRRGLQDMVLEDADLFTADEIDRSPFYQEFLRPLDCGLMIGRETTGVRRGTKVIICSQRAWRAPPPEPDERRAFAVLSNHLIRSLQIHQRLASPEGAHDHLADLLDRLSCGAAIVGADGRLLHVNAMAERLAGDGFSLRQGRLVASAVGEQVRIDGLLRRVLAPSLQDDEAAPIALSRPSGMRPILMQAIPLSARADIPLAPLLDDLGAALVIIADPDREAPACSADALQRLGLTAAEARIAALLGAGRSPREIAEQQHILTATVRFHIKNLYSKLDIRRQGELTRIVQAVTLVNGPASGRTH